MEWDHKQSLKEVARHVAFRLGAERVLMRRRQKRGFVVDHLNGATPADRFREAYRRGAWVHSTDQVSISGFGSESAATANLGSTLSELLATVGCRRLLDIGCGDWNWMRNVKLPCDYVGVDIVPELIEQNRRLYGRPGVHFEVVDAIAGPLPEADVALCREVLFHLSFRDGLAVLSNVGKAARWLLATSDSSIWFNSDIRTGDFRKINLMRAPYNLVSPQQSITDDVVSPGRYLGLWASGSLR